MNEPMNEPMNEQNKRDVYLELYSKGLLTKADFWKLVFNCDTPYSHINFSDAELHAMSWLDSIARKCDSPAIQYKDLKPGDVFQFVDKGILGHCLRVVRGYFGPTFLWNISPHPTTEVRVISRVSLKPC